MSKFQYGDVVKFDPEIHDFQAWGEYTFMYLCEVSPNSGGVGEVVVLKSPTEDDMWMPGMTITCGDNELVLAK